MPRSTGSFFPTYLRNWLVGIGVFELIGAIAFVGGAVVLPRVRGGLLITAAVLGLIGLPLVFSGVKSGKSAAQMERTQGAGTDLPSQEALEYQRARLRALGVPGSATIDAFQDTGVVVAGEHLCMIDMTVSLEGRAPYRVSHPGVVPAETVVRVTMGMSVPVRADPSDPQQLMIEWKQMGVPAGD